MSRSREVVRVGRSGRMSWDWVRTGKLTGRWCRGGGWMVLRTWRAELDGSLRRLPSRCYSADETNLKISVDSGRSEISRTQWKMEGGAVSSLDDNMIILAGEARCL